MSDCPWCGFPEPACQCVKEEDYPCPLCQKYGHECKCVTIEHEKDCEFCGGELTYITLTKKNNNDYVEMVFAEGCTNCGGVI